MKHRTSLAALLLALLILSAAGSFAAQNAAQKTSTPAAPIPPQIGAAKKIFVTNAGWDCAPLDSIFRGAPNRVYDEFYVAMKGWGRYELVSAPEQADLDLAIGLACAAAAADVTHGTSVALYDAKLVLTMSQPKGNAIIWRIVQPVKPAKPKFRFGQYRDTDVSDTVEAMIDELKALAARSSASAPNSTSAP